MDLEAEVDGMRQGASARPHGRSHPPIPPCPQPRSAHLVGLDGPVLHVQVPHLDSEVVPGHDVPAAVAEFDVGDGGDDLRKE